MQDNQNKKQDTGGELKINLSILLTSSQLLNSNSSLNSVFCRVFLPCGK